MAMTRNHAKSSRRSDDDNASSMNNMLTQQKNSNFTSGSVVVIAKRRLLKVTNDDDDDDKSIYYMDKGVLQRTKTLVESICRYIRDPSGVFSVCNAREWYIGTFPRFLLLLFSKWPQIQGLWN